MFALGLLSWMYGRPAGDHAQLAGAEVRRQAGDLRCERGGVQGRLQLRRDHRAVRALVPGEGGAGRAGHVPQHRRARPRCRGGSIAASARSGLPLFYASYPITPASELLHELSRHKNFGVMTLQAEDEIAAANMALGAAFAGQLAVTGTSGPGMDLKAETLGLAAIMELPMIIVDVQRGGPSTGIARRRPSRATCCWRCSAVTASRRCRSSRRLTPADCFDTAIEAARIAVTYRTPVILLSDTFLSNSSEPWKIPDVDGAPHDRAAVRDDPLERRRVPAVRARREARAPVGDARHARPGPPHRRAGARGRDREHQLRPAEP